MDPDKPEEQPDIVDPDIDVSGVNGVDLRDLVKNPATYVDEQIVVYGKFRGNNLYGDLSIKDKRTPRDFIIKLANAAIWVTGRRPRGDGFRLDPKSDGIRASGSMSSARPGSTRVAVLTI